MSWIIAIPALPALAFVLTVALPRKMRNLARWVPIVAMIIATIVAGFAFVQTLTASDAGTGATAPLWAGAFQIASVDGASIALSLRIDNLSAVLALVVAVVGLCVQIFSLGYMHDDERKGWYFSVVSLFTAAMLAFVLANDVLLLFVSWEIMGLCSYFLIGFWFEEEEPAYAAQKAFIVTRIGDLGFFFALIAIFKQVGSFDLPTVISSSASWEPIVCIVIASGLLLAAVGKSAQVPLHVWLPDAMAGPTPASALIHAATMVASGVLLIVFTMPIFLAAPEVLVATMIIGLLTALVGGLIACVQNDIKKVLAYSTISQIGLMFAALGVGSIVAAVFHLIAHAFFKALLFLGSGSIIHAVHSQDMRDMGGLRKKLPGTWLTFLIGLLALAGLPPLVGFFSKDEIVVAYLHAHMEWGAVVIFALTALTAFYSSRLYLNVFEGSLKKNAHDSGPSMLVPLTFLAIVTVFAGWLGSWFMEFIGYHGQYPSIELVVISLVVAALGFSLGFLQFRRQRAGAQNADDNLRKDGVIKTVLANKLYFDFVYEKIFVSVFSLIAQGAAVFDRVVIDGMVNGLASISTSTGDKLRKIQSGKLQSYQRLAVTSAIVLVIVVGVAFLFTGNY